VAAALFLALAAFGQSCGSRSGLYGFEPCGNQPRVRSCVGPCGEGVQECIDDYWTECSVATTSRACRNDCGEGVEECVDGEWSACLVPTVPERACTDLCGPGSQVCVDGQWQECIAPPTTRACENDCGGGVETCRDHAWGKCEVPVVRVECFSVCGSGFETCLDGEWHACDAPQPLPPRLTSIVRDFRIDHPDFELDVMHSGGDFGIVEDMLGPDGLPVYKPPVQSPTTTGKYNFDQWYRDVPGVNQTTSIDLQLAPSPTTPGLFVYEDNQFFPIDGMLQQNEGNAHNYHFTLEMHTQFVYQGGEVFTFRGDDDLFTFINGRLGIDLGGVHGPLEGSIDLDAMAGALGIVPGGVYDLDFFFAERHTSESNFRIETTIGCFHPPG
jgi:fibro-slime domain-containing protein